MNQHFFAREHRVSFIQNPNNPKNYSCTILIYKYMKQSIYKISNFYQNHRHYINSKSELQLQGLNMNGEHLTICAPDDYEGGWSISPSGLVAWSLFDNTYNWNVNNVALPINKDIAWKSDLKKNIELATISNFQNNNETAYIGRGKLPENLPLNDNEDFWM